MPEETVPFNFGGLEPEFSSWENAHFVVIPVCYDLTTTYKSGTRGGPRAVIEASTHMELWDEELWRETYRVGIHTMGMVEPKALEPERVADEVFTISRKVVESGKFPVLVGGEHSLSLGMVQALKEKHPDLSVLHLDAHADLRDRYQGSPFNHACIARRISEVCPITLAGVRSLSREEVEHLKSSTVRVFFMADILEREGWEEEICEHLSREVYVTIDLDVFDPAIMPSVGTPEPGGLGWYDVTGLLKTVAMKKEVVGFDVVELSPMPGTVAPDFMAAKLIYRTVGYVVESREEGAVRP